jgi:Tfp pilus assembly protein FimT
VTLVILAVMAAAVVPAFLRQANPPDLDAAEGALGQLFRTARDSAVVSASEVTLTLDSVSTRFWLQARPGRAITGEHDGTTTEAGRGAAAGRLGSLSSPGSPGGTQLSGNQRVVAGSSDTVSNVLGLPGTVHLDLYSARAVFTFAPSGAASGDSLLLRNSTGQIRRIRLDSWSGRLRAE